MAENEEKKEVKEEIKEVKAEIEKKEDKKQPKEEAKEEKKEEIILKRNYTIPLIKAYEKPETERNKKASRMLRSFIARHMKTTEDKVKINPKVSEKINARGMRKPPKKIKVILSKNKEGIVKCELQ